MYAVSLKNVYLFQYFGTEKDKLTGLGIENFVLVFTVTCNQLYFINQICTIKNICRFQKQKKSYWVLVPPRKS